MSNDDGKRLYVARAVMVAEATAIMAAHHKLGHPMSRAVSLILGEPVEGRGNTLHRPGKVVTTGIGKSGLVARRIAAVLCSTGTPAVYLHPVEALHGDIGIVTQGNPVIMISKSGATPELVTLLEALRGMQFADTPLIGIIGTPESWLAQTADVVLDASVQREADPLNLIPTASTAVATALGDALACALMHARGWTAADYARIHPAGSGGK